MKNVEDMRAEKRRLMEQFGWDVVDPREPILPMLDVREAGRRTAWMLVFMFAQGCITGGAVVYLAFMQGWIRL